jgi:hypothetical protein
MASSYTSRIRLEKQANGENPNSWGLLLNQNVIDLVDDAIGAYTTVTMSSVDVTLTSNSGIVDQARSPFLEIDGTVTQSVNIVIPAVSKGYFINNVATVSAGTSITLKTAAGTGVNVPTSGKMLVVCDGVSVHVLNTSGFNLGTAASANVGSSVAAVPDVSIANTIYARLSAANTYTEPNTFEQVNSPIVTLTDAASVAVDFSTGCHFLVTLGGNRTLTNPTNGKVGQTGHIYIIQDSTGGRTLSYGDMYNFVSATAPVLSSQPSRVDMLVFAQRETSVIDCALLKHFG